MGSSSFSAGSCLSGDSNLIEMEEETTTKVYCCRVCFEESDSHDLKSTGLIAPCRCKGTQKYVHSKCLRRWQENVQKRSLTDERAYRCGVCRSLYSQAPPDPRWLTRLVHGVTGLVGAAGVSLLAFGLTGSPWPHFLLLLLVLLGSRSHALLITSLLLVGTALAALHAKGLRLVMRLDGGGRLGLAVVRHGAAIDGLGAGTLLVASEELEHSIFRQSVVLVYEHSSAGARGVILTSSLQRAPEGYDSDEEDVINGLAITLSATSTTKEEKLSDWDNNDDEEQMARNSKWVDAVMDAEDDYDGYPGIVDNNRDTSYKPVTTSTSDEQQQKHRSSSGGGKSTINAGQRRRGSPSKGGVSNNGRRQVLSSSYKSRREEEYEGDEVTSSSTYTSNDCVNATTRHFFGGPVGMPGEDVWQEIALLHNVPGISGAQLVVPQSSTWTLYYDENNQRSRSLIDSSSREHNQEDGLLIEEEEEEEDDDDDTVVAACGELLHNSDDDGVDNTKERFKKLRNIYAGGSLPDVLQRAVNKPGSVVHVYHGVCAWAAGQLEGEIRAGSWGFATATVEEVFVASPETLWNALTRATRVQWLV